MGEIYKITHNESGKVYIGKATNAHARWVEHERTSKKNTKQTHLYKAIRKYGWDSFQKEVIDVATTKDELNKKEMYWISYYDSCNHEKGYNETLGGDGGDTFSNLSEERKEMMRQKNKIKSTGRKKSEEERKRMSEIRRGKPHPVDPEKQKKRIEAVRAATIGRVSPNKGKVLTDGTKQKIKENNAKFWKNKHHSEETKTKIREKRKSQDMSYRHQSYTLRSPDGAIICFPSVTDVKKALNITNVTRFYRLVAGKISNMNGWEFVSKGGFINGNN